MDIWVAKQVQSQMKTFANGFSTSRIWKFYFLMYFIEEIEDPCSKFKEHFYLISFDKDGWG